MEQQQHGLLQMREYYSSSCRSRTAGITSRGSSEFEFQFSEQVLYDEPPLSPKLATALSNYACFPINSESAISNSDGIISQRKINILESGAIINDFDRTSSATVVINASSDEVAISNIRVPLRSLMQLDRRESEQLPPLFNKNGAHVMMNDQLLHRPSDSDIIIQDSTAEDHDDDAPSSSASSPDQLFRSDQKKKTKKVEELKKKSRIRQPIWSFINLDFLKKARSGKAVAHKYRLQQLLSIDHELGWRADHISVRRGANDTKRGGYILAHRHNNNNIIFDGKEARMNAIQHSAPISPAASPSHHSLYSHTIYLRGSLDQAAAAATTPISPKTFNYLRPSSPHAEHYRQQRARAEEVRRKTSLPYRQPLLMLGGASCFQPQAVATHFTNDASMCLSSGIRSPHSISEQLQAALHQRALDDGSSWPKKA